MHDKARAEERSRSRSRSSGSNSGRRNGARSRSASESRSRSRSRSRSSERDSYRLHLADLPDSIRKSELEKLFAEYGPLREVWLTQSTPVFGFAVYRDKESASAALKATDGITVSGCRIKVSYARPRTRGQGRGYYHPNMRCYHCGYSGHFYRDCPDVCDNSRYDSRRRVSSRRDRGDRYGADGGGHRSSRRGYEDDYDGYRRSRRSRY